MPNQVKVKRPWAALWALALGFFMILIDSTIVAVANPAIMHGLHASMIDTLWATSGYLLAYAVPLLITGRLGDTFGPRRMYLTGLTIFTIASLACGLAPTIEILIAARVLQGIGASLLTPQTMTVITRIFPAGKRGQAMSIWGITAGLAMLVGPVLGGFVLGTLGWEWIFFINLPVGIIGFILAKTFVPKLERHRQPLDWIGILLSGTGLALVIFGVQEGASYNWGEIWGPVTVPSLIITGLLILGGFVWWQSKLGVKALMPLAVFKDRNFSVGSIAIIVVGLGVATMGLPLMFYFQLVLGLSPVNSALMLLPLALISGVLAMPVGKLADKIDPRRLPLIGIGGTGFAMLLYSYLLKPDTPVLLLLIPSVIMGAANVFMWGPLATLTTFNVRADLAGAASGVYNTSRQIGSVIGAAVIAAAMQTLLVMNLGANAGEAGQLAGTGKLPEPLIAGYSQSMSQSLLIPSVILLAGALIVLAFEKRKIHVENLEHKTLEK